MKFLAKPLLAFAFLFLFAAPAFAGPNDNLSGGAWADNIGAISFNSTNHDGDVDYGVSVDQAGNLSGEAWSDNAGWISFNAGDVAGCPQDPPAVPCAPKLNRETGVVSGWARAYRAIEPEGQTLGGWDGWIHLRGKVQSDNSDFGVLASGCDWGGLAWGGTDYSLGFTGWVQFDAEGTGFACVEVVQPGLRVVPHSADLEVGGQMPFQALYDPDGSSPQPETDVTESASWSSSGPAVAVVTNISPKGIVTGVSPGDANITATYLGTNDSALVNVTQSPPSVPKCEPTSQSGKVGDPFGFTAKDGSSPYSWSAPSGTPSSGAGSSFITRYSSPGNYVVTLTDSASRSDTCSVSAERVEDPENRVPVAEAGISTDGSTYSSKIIVTKGVPTRIYFSADEDVTGDGAASRDPDGWTHPTLGVSNGGSCAWNADLNQGTPTFEKTFGSPPSPSGCNFNQEYTFNDDLEGQQSKTFTYEVLKITDARGAVSNIGFVQVEVRAEGGFTCNSLKQCVFGGGGESCRITPECESVIVDPPVCTSNCGGGGGGGGGCTDPVTCPVVTDPNALELGSDTSFFCPSHQVELKWNYSDPNGDQQASFRLQVDNNSDFSSMIVDVYQDSSNKLFIVPPNVLSFSTTYYFRVAVKDSTGAWSNWSSSANFTTPASCPPAASFKLRRTKDISVNVTGVGAGTSDSTTIWVEKIGAFSGTVILVPQSISPNIPGASFSFATASLDQDHYSSGFSFKVTVPGSTAPGNYTIKIKGTSGGVPDAFVDVLLRVNFTSPDFREI
ncbi:hypothetical protein A2661_01750 [Candidatus Giovannonibacteria bacterium RIFCSPHIGHO2_01_FULL_45_24]|uniref:Fibronectin type-III domain-containing protein n=1 Tax=Candidatus Giovannonibacteria bacterium RIFCSPLOWO2_01_FULL_46_32 TaxID=1798353 RepID=A0A1F5XHL0_9BACT|nr:MAG: hypothetical protein A2661_01750 [Candidatus Giovannonibacteria bacterium RIFCSPHIGHO2_01_FULL_45_24]OGF87286.1 MAG: hypothetical protein A3B19_03625 [Candidatus Giovannonibacteria bacterium RIFCSPLOWO2_01_FULL_46_32]